MRPAPLLCVLLAGCGSISKDNRITYATVQSLNAGVDGEWILHEYPQARGVSRRPDGRLERVEYRVDDPQGHGQTLVLHFDEYGVLARKDYSGQLLKPLDVDPEAQKGITGKPRNR